MRGLNPYQAASVLETPLLLLRMVVRGLIPFRQALEWVLRHLCGCRARATCGRHVCGPLHLEIVHKVASAYHDHIDAYLWAGESCGPGIVATASQPRLDLETTCWSMICSSLQVQVRDTCFHLVSVRRKLVG
jgi:hypothetical protein